MERLESATRIHPRPPTGSGTATPDNRDRCGGNGYQLTHNLLPVLGGLVERLESTTRSTPRPLHLGEAPSAATERDSCGGRWMPVNVYLEAWRSGSASWIHHQAALGLSVEKGTSTAARHDSCSEKWASERKVLWDRCGIGCRSCPRSRTRTPVLAAHRDA